MNEMTYWMDGFVFQLILPSGTDPGELKYWMDGFPIQEQMITSSTPSDFVPIICFF